MQGYIVWDIKKRKEKEISFFHTIIHEGYYPWKNRSTWGEEEKALPATFFPTAKDITNEEEF
jgi:hypothetical protein